MPIELPKNTHCRAEIKEGSVWPSLSNVAGVAQPNGLLDKNEATEQVATKQVPTNQIAVE